MDWTAIDFSVLAMGVVIGVIAMILFSDDRKARRNPRSYRNAKRRRKEANKKYGEHR